MQQMIDEIEDRRYEKLENKFQEWAEHGKGAKFLIVQLLEGENWEVVAVK